MNSQVIPEVNPEIFFLTVYFRHKHEDYDITEKMFSALSYAETFVENAKDQGGFWDRSRFILWTNITGIEGEWRRPE